MVKALLLCQQMPDKPALGLAILCVCMSPEVSHKASKVFRLNHYAAATGDAQGVCAGQRQHLAEGQGAGGIQHAEPEGAPCRAGPAAAVLQFCVQGTRATTVEPTLMFL